MTAASRMKERQSLDILKAYFCRGQTPFRRYWTREGKAARFGKQMLTKDLEVSRILKKMTNTKTAVELMLMPDTKGRKKADKKLFPVCSALD